MTYFPTVKSLDLRYETQGRVVWAVCLTIGKKTTPVTTITVDGQQVTCGISEKASAYNVGKRLGDLTMDLLTARNAEDKWSNDVIAKACAQYGKNVIDGIAPDCTFSVRAGMLLPMNRLPLPQDADTLTMTSVIKWADANGRAASADALAAYGIGA